LEIQRDIFVFQCLIGCRIEDLYRMAKSNVVSGAIEYIPKEGSKAFNRYREIDEDMKKELVSMLD
jgi:benzoyl-CoA reductase/2-hydroxyglutaryl-CoA dehydratase subunit BcrC/BadD/HgdB